MNPAPAFGEWLTGTLASDENPRKHGMYVRTIRRRGRMNPGVFYELTDGRGDFWQYPTKIVTRRYDNERESVGEGVRYAEDPVVVADEPVRLYEITKTLDWGVLIEHGQWGIGVCFEGLSRTSALALLRRAVEGWPREPEGAIP